MSTGSKFPTALDTSTDLPNIDETAKENDEGKEHDVMHLRLHQAVRALETKVGIDDSEDPDSLDYRLTQVEENGGGGGGGSGLEIAPDDSESYQYDTNKEIPEHPSKWLVATVNGNKYLIPGFALKKRVVIFNTVGTFSYTPSVGVTQVKVLIVGGGGAGGAGHNSNYPDYGRNGGGGGAGGLYEGVIDVDPATTYTCVVGAGGIGTAYDGNPTAGGASSAFGKTIPGGGRGANSRGAGGSVNGGSGGGATGAGSGSDYARPGGVTTTDGSFLGHDGGNGSNSTYGSFGGGGAGSAGGRTLNSSPYSGGPGGDGYASDISGEMLYYAGGGGGASLTTGGPGGNGVGGTGGNANGVNGGAGAAGTGSGGGGSRAGIGGNGGCGCVIISEL